MPNQDRANYIGTVSILGKLVRKRKNQINWQGKANENKFNLYYQIGAE